MTRLNGVTKRLLESLTLYDLIELKIEFFL